jgi:hypothetical protein
VGEGGNSNDTGEPRRDLVSTKHFGYVEMLQWKALAVAGRERVVQGMPVVHHTEGRQQVKISGQE